MVISALMRLNVSVYVNKFMKYIFYCFLLRMLLWQAIVVVVVGQGHNWVLPLILEVRKSVFFFYRRLKFLEYIGH